MARIERPGQAARGRGRGLPVATPLAGAAPQGRMGRPVMAQGIRRPRRHADRAGDLLRGDGALQRTRAGQRAGPRDGRARGDPPRHRGAEAALPGADPLGGGDLVPGLFGAGGGVGPRLPEDARRKARRGLGRERTEGLDHARARGQVVHAGRAHGPRRAQAPGPHLLPDGHGPGRGGCEAAGADHGRIRVQRDLHGRGLHPRRERDRRSRERVGSRDHDAHERACRPRLCRPGGAQDAHPGRDRAGPVHLA